MTEKSITDIADVYIGMRLEAMDKFGKWFMAKVIEFDEEEQDILVHFDGWSSRYDEYVEVNSGRLRPISPNTLLKTAQRKKSKPLNVGDRIQAKWQDGRMYFGRVLSIGNDEVNVLFDDGVEYTAPYSNVRRRRPDRLPDSKAPEDYLKSTHHSIAMDARGKRSKKRVKSDDSQSSLPSSPPSSPIFVPKRSKHYSPRIMEDDSTTETESDMDDSRIRIRENPVLDCDESLGNDSSLDVKGADLKGTSPSSSDSEQPYSLKRSKYKGLREPYKLRSGPGQLSPVSEDLIGASSSKMTSSSVVTSAFLTPPLGSHSPVKSSHVSIATSVSSEFKKMTPPETPKIQPSNVQSSTADGQPQKPKKTKQGQSSRGGAPQTSPGTDSDLVSVTAQALATVTSTSKPLHKKKTSPKVSLKSEGTSKPSHKMKSSPKASLTFEETSKPASHRMKSSPKTSLSSEAAQKVTVKTSARLAARGQEGEASFSKRSFSDSSVLSAAHKSYSGKKRAASVSTRNRAQTMFENMMKKSERHPAKLAPKELVIVWDHNDHKCKFTGCNKSFRKESLLLSHVKHYHNVKPKTPIKGKEKGPTKEKSSVISPCSPNALRSPLRSSASPTPKSPKSPELKSILSPISKRDKSKSSSILRRSKSPTESFFETIERQQNSTEILTLLEQSMKHQTQTSPIKHPSTHRSHSAANIRSPGHASIRPLALELSRPKQKSGSGGISSKYFITKALPKLSTVQPERPLNIITHPLKFPLVEIKALPREALPPSPILKRSPSFTSKGLQVGKASPPSSAAGSSVHQMEVTPRCPEASAEDVYVEDQDIEMRSLSPTESEEENSDDVVHCICGSIVDEGFMIQCEQCLCWQHGDCIGITKETLPEKYVCCICTNPPGLRLRMKYRFDRDWFADGTLPSFPGAPKFTETAAMRRSHCLADALYKLKKMAHSTKVKLQAASTPNHPYLKQWAKECSHLTRNDIVTYLMATLQPMSHDPLTDINSEEEEEGLGEDGTEDAATRMSPSSPDESTSLNKPTRMDEQVVTDSSARLNNLSVSDSLTRPGKHPHSSSSPVDVTGLCLDPLPLDTNSSYPPVSTPQPSPNDISLETTPDPKTLQLAPLPPLSSEELHQITNLVLKSTLAQSTPQTRTISSDLSSSADLSLSIPSSSSESLHPSLVSMSNSNTSIPDSEIPIPVASKEESTKSASFDSVISDSEFNGGFGIQETSVFALDEQPDIKHPKTIRTEPLGGSFSSRLPINPGNLPSSQRSAFKPVPLPSSQLASLLAGKALSSTSLQQGSKPLPSVPSNCDTALGSCGLKPKVDTNPVFSETVSSLSTLAMTSMDVVPLEAFVEAFLRTDGGNWCQRMLLLDHIEAVQDKIAAWMDSIQNQLQDMPCDEGEMEDVASLLKDVQSTVKDLSRIHWTVVTSTES